MGSAKEGVVYTGSLPYSWPLIVVLSEFHTPSCNAEDFIHLSVIMVVLKEYNIVTLCMQYRVGKPCERGGICTGHNNE